MYILKKNKMLHRNRPITWLFFFWIWYSVLFCIAFGLCKFQEHFSSLMKKFGFCGFFSEMVCLLNWLWYGYFLNCCQILANPAVYFVKIVIGLWNGELIQVADSLLSKPLSSVQEPMHFPGILENCLLPVKQQGWLVEQCWQETQNKYEWK